MTNAVQDKLNTFHLLGTSDDKVVYAMKRLKRLGIDCFIAQQNNKDVDVFAKAQQQAVDSDSYVAVYFDSNKIKGLFVIAPKQGATTDEFDYYIENQDDLRWDSKSVDEQKRDEEFDRFNLPGYDKKIIDKYGACTPEICYADVRLTKSGVEPYRGQRFGMTFDIFRQATIQAGKDNKKVAVWLENPEISGLFTVSAQQDCSNEALLETYKDYIKRQAQLRWDKPIEQQKMEQNIVNNGRQNI